MIKRYKNKVKWWKKGLGVCLIIYGVMPLFSVWAIPFGICLLDGMSVKTRLKSIGYELQTKWRLRGKW
ncbi:MAG: hypothetical protein ACTSXD_11630 [Candidatus Heimdallarchaeaceae archaeon]